MISALIRPSLEAAIAQTFFEHSTTLGVRVRPMKRYLSPRRVEVVQTRFGEIRVKVSERAHAPLIAPEHEDCARAAKAAQVPLRVVYEAALQAAWGKSL